MPIATSCVTIVMVNGSLVLHITKTIAAIIKATSAKILKKKHFFVQNSSINNHC